MLIIEQKKNFPNVSRLCSWASFNQIANATTTTTTKQMKGIYCILKNIQ